MANRFRTAGVCRRGHVLSVACEEDDPGERCRTCGAQVLRACETCQSTIRGRREWERFLAAFGDGPAITDWQPVEEDYVPPAFCHDCGEPYPWVGRQERIWEIENRLNADDFDSGTALALSEQLAALVEAEDEKEQVRIWRRALEVAPGLLDKTGVRQLAVSVMTEYVKKQVGV